MSSQTFRVERTRVTFAVGGETVVGRLYRPQRAGVYNGLVFLGPLTSVKEQVPGNYAQAMAERGFAALAIDNRHFGESSGEPRQYEHPARKVEDIREAAAFLRTSGAAHIGAVGVCAGAGYMAAAVAEDDTIKAFAAVAGFFHAADKQREWMGDRYQAALARAQQARERYHRTGECEIIPAVGEGDVAMPLAEAFQYYGTPRGAVDNYQNRFAVMSREHTLPWDAQQHAPAITQPTLIIHSEKALAPALARRFYANLIASKQQHWLPSEGQIDFYDDPTLITPAANLMASHFQTHLPQ